MIHISGMGQTVAVTVALNGFFQAVALHLVFALKIALHQMDGVGSNPLAAI